MKCRHILPNYFGALSKRHVDRVNIRIKDGGAQPSKQRKKGSGTFRGVSNYPVPQAAVTPAVSPKQIVSALNISREQCTTF